MGSSITTTTMTNHRHSPLLRDSYVSRCLHNTPSHELTNPQVQADANLTIWTIHMTLLLAERDRASAGLGDFFSWFGRFQLDGDSGNWNRVMFAFAEYLVSRRIFMQLDVVRNPAGDTHEVNVLVT